MVKEEILFMLTDLKFTTEEFGGWLCNNGEGVQVKQCGLCSVEQTDYETKTGAD